MDDPVYPEYQVLGNGPEAQESAKAAEKCKKNPGHKAFIPICDINKQHLPECFKGDEEMLEFIKLAADLTVRLRARTRSSDRPEDGYYGAGGSIRAGTGYITTVMEHIDDPCKCCACADKSVKSQYSWNFEISTAKHVVYDDAESTTVTVDFFYDSEESRKDGKMKTVEEGQVRFTFDKTDTCWFSVPTCDTSLGKKRLRLEQKLKKRYAAEDFKNIMFIVSHPHGIAKHVTFGELKDEEVFKIDHTQDSYVRGTEASPWEPLRRLIHYKFRYSADSCPGSSGAALWWLGGEGLYTTHRPYHCFGGGKGGFNVGYL